jgi:hypothetical protein
MKQVIKFPKLHDGQLKIIIERKRFNVIACGRRFGKTKLAQRLLLWEKDRSNGALSGHPVAYIVPAFRYLEEVYREIVANYLPVITHKHQDKRIDFIGGGFIEFWSMENFDSIRGRKYKRLVMDEAAINDTDYLKEAWEQAFRALLMDLKGDAYFFSTPKGIKHYFKELADHYKKLKSWTFFQMPTTTNPYIDPAEVEEARQTLPPVVFAQEYLADFTDMKSDKLFIFAFNKLKHVPAEPIEYDKRYPVILSVDFNVSPMTALICQHDIHYRFIKVIDEYRLLNSDIYELCDKVKQDYDTRKLFVTGDAAGWSRSAATRGHKSMFDIIQTQLNLNWSQIKTPKGKPKGYVSDKRNLANALFNRHNNFHISSKCPYLVEDLLNIEVTSTGHMEKSADSTKSHLLDCLCDYLFSMCKDAVKMNFISK